MQRQISELIKAHKSALAYFRMIEPSRTRDFMLSLLFLKYVSGNRIKQIQMPPNAHFDALFQQRDIAYLDALVNVAFQELASANSKHLQGVFDGVDFGVPYGVDSGTWNRNLGSLLELINPLTLKDPSFLGMLYEQTLDPKAAKHTGSFFTPPMVGDLLAGLLEPKPGESICDPTCGTGNLLVSCGRFLQRKGSGGFQLFGQEISRAHWMVGRLNLLLHGMGGHLEKGDTIKNPQLVDDHGNLLKFDVVVGNPPFSMKGWGAESAETDGFKRFHRGVPHKNRGDLAFVSHMIETMDPEHGRAGVILPYSVLSRKGVEMKIRRAFLQENLVDAVIGLPEKLFRGNHAVAIILFKRARENDDVLFVDARQGSTDDLTRVLSAYHSRTNERRYARLVPCREIETSPCLDPYLYVS